MTELFKYQKRISFQRGYQKKFIQFIQSELSFSIDQLSKLLNIHPRTLRDWRREKFSMSLSAIRTLCKRVKIAMPANILIQDPFWYTRKGGIAGGRAVYKKYGTIGGSPHIRLKKWREWWETKGKFLDRPIFRKLPFQKPQLSQELAEFIGIMMGDGGLSHFQLCITLHHKDDLAFSRFVVNLIQKLFNTIPSKYHVPKNSVYNIVVSRKGLVEYLHGLGLPIGNKVRQNFDIPNWIRKNKKFTIACLRGLIDTDGSIFVHTYRAGRKWYSYKKIAFCSASAPLRMSVYTILKKLGFNPRISQERDVRLDNKADVERYFTIIGSHNQKHLRKYGKSI